MICPRCGHSNPEGEESCLRCGAILRPGGGLIQERRWVSALFFDISRFTEYTLRHPLEVTWETTNEALQIAASQVRLRGGHIDKFFGDGFLAVFGVPRSQESDAQAALEAARATVASSPLPSRVGVASGLVLRTPLGGGLAGDQTVLGPAVNLSQRLSQAAPPGEVWCDEVTVRLVPRAITELLPPQPFRGFAEPLVVFRYLGMRQGPLDMVGRERELEVLQQALEAARRGEGRRVVVYGPMGVGKSHLVRYFLETLPEGVQGVMVPRLIQGIPLRDTLRQGLQGLLPGGFGQLRQLELPEHLQVALEFSVGLRQRPPLPAAELDALLVEAWGALLSRLARGMPVVVILEDLQSADATVLEFTRRPAPAGVLLVLVARQNRWGADPDVVFLPLEPLSLEESRRLILCYRPDLGTASLEHLVEASGGYPLAVQVLSLTPSGEPEPIPLYQPRLDTLPRLARLALQAAAVLGVTAPPELVRHLVGEEADLARLVGEGFLETDGKGQLRFVVPWLREAVLGQVGGQQARRWHQQAARWYQRQGRLSEAAAHLEAAGETAAAYRLWRLAAQQAWSEGRYAEALLGYLEALRLAEGGVRGQAVLEAAEAHLALGRYGEALELAGRLLAASEAPLVLRQRARAVYLEASWALGQDEPKELRREEPLEPRLALALARTAPTDEALTLLEGLPPALQGSALLVKARLWLRSGQLEQARAACEAYLEEHAQSPVGCFEARQICSEALWRQFRPKEALKALGPPPHEALPAWFRSLYQSSRAALCLDLGQLEWAGSLLEEGLLCLEGAPTWAVERVSRVRLRYLVESGQLEEALYYGEAALARSPSASLLAYLALARALASGRDSEVLLRLLRGLEGLEDVEAQAVGELALGLRKGHLRQDPIPHLQRAARLARQVGNPSLYYHALVSLGLFLGGRSSQKALALSRYLFRSTLASGFETQHGYARLLQAQLLLMKGQEPLGLLDFEAKTPLAWAWQQTLRGLVDGRRPSFEPQQLRGYGVLGVWLRWQARAAPCPERTRAG